MEKFEFKVSNLYIAQVKEKCGIKERENYNKPKKEDLKQPVCPMEKEDEIDFSKKRLSLWNNVKVKKLVKGWLKCDYRR